MSALGVFQTFIDIAFGVGLFFITARITRQPKDDPRLSRGLQLLQAKISVLEDLSDKTETQVNQLVTLLEQKIRDVQNKIQLADKHVQLIRESMDRSLEVAKIFQDKIPHQEIIERQNTKKYLKAARLAHQGKSVEEIAQQVDLPTGELEFIAKVNRDQLMFSEDQLPDWAREEDTQAQPTSPIAASENARLTALANQQNLIENLQQVQTELDQMLQTESVARDLSSAFNVPQVATNSLNKLGQEFRKAVNEAEIEAQPKFATGNKLSFVELTPPTEDVLTNFEEAPKAAPLLDLSNEEIANLKATAEAIPPQISKAATTLTKTAGQQARMQAAMSAVAQANAQARAQMMPESQPAKAAPQKRDPRAEALAQARAAAQELRKPQPRASVNVGAPEVKKVEFPRIKTTDNLG